MQEPTTLPFQTFWSWLASHCNCILRAGTPESVLYDDDDLHWHFGSEGPELLLVQVIRGKRILGELLVNPEHVAYVEGTQGEQDEEYVFELISETEKDRLSAYFFVMAHGFESEDEDTTPRRVH